MKTWPQIGIKYILINILVFDAIGQNIPIRKWTIDKNILWLNDTLIVTPNLHYEVEFTIEFDKSKCCPVLDLQSYLRQEFSSVSCYDPDTVYRELVWFKNSIFILDPTKENVENFIVCNLNEVTERYTCKLRVEGQNYEPKQRYMALGYLCQNKTISLQNIVMEANILLDTNSSKCEPIERSRSALSCENYYDFVSFPNLFGHYKQTEAAQAVDLFNTLLKGSKSPCHKHLIYILCQAFFPQCPAAIEHEQKEELQRTNTYKVNYLVTICRKMCQELVEACSEALDPVLKVVRCEYYNSRLDSDTCVYNNVTCAPLTIPENAKTPIGKDSYEAGESISYKCQEGYTLKGNSIVNCTYSGLWTEDPTCEKQETDRNAIDEKLQIGLIIPGIIIFLIASGFIALIVHTRRRRKTEPYTHAGTKRKRQ